MAWTARAVGQEVINAAYGEVPVAADRAEHLAAAARRLDLVAPFFKIADPLESDGSLPTISKEVAAIAAGDIPLLLDRVGRGRNSSEGAVAFRLAEHQAKALYWAEVFRRRDIRPGVFKPWISAAYCHLDWDTIRKWKPKLQKYLGPKFEGLLTIAKLNADLDRQMGRTFDLESARQQLTADGARYKRLLTINAQGGMGSGQYSTGQDR